MKLAALVCALVFAAGGTLYAELRVHFIDVGQGAAVLLETDDHAVLVDAGEGEDAAEYIERLGIAEIQLAVATHAHADHIGGFPAVFEQTDVRKLWYNGQEHTTITFERFLDAVLASDAEYKEPGRGHTRRFGELRLRVLHPEGSAAEYEGDLHDQNIVLRAEYREFAVTLTGDAETGVEYELLDAGEQLEATALKMGHHGSRTSSSASFVEAVAPEIVVYQAGAGNPYGHPHEEALERVRAAGDPEIYGTDVHGTIIIRTDGHEYEVLTEAGNRTESARRAETTERAEAAKRNPGGVP